MIDKGERLLFSAAMDIQKQQHDAVMPLLRRLFNDSPELFAQRDDSERAAEVITDMVFQVEEWTPIMVDTMRPLIGRLMAAGMMAHATFFRVARYMNTKGVQDFVTFDLPPEVAAEIESELAEQMAQPYWRMTSETARIQIQGIIAENISTGGNMARMAREMREAMTLGGGKNRAMTIARTEAASAINKGHILQMGQLENLGVIVEKIWFATGDDLVRQSHIDADGQRVRGSEAKFVVGGYECTHPGDYNLPGHERIRCRCITLSETVDATQEEQQQMAEELGLTDEADL